MPSHRQEITATDPGQAAATTYGALAVRNLAPQNERHEALQTLQKLEVLTPFSALETYHGRVAKADAEQPWGVDSEYHSGDQSGRVNAHMRPCLYTSDAETAREFGQYRGGFVIYSQAVQILEDRIRAGSPEAFRQGQRAKELAELAAMDPQKRKAFLDDWIEKASTPGDFREPTLHGKDFSLDELEQRYTGRPIKQGPFGEWEIAGSYLYDQLPDDDRHELWAEARQRYKLEVHRIVSDDPEAMILQSEFAIASLAEAEAAKLRAAVSTLMVSVFHDEFIKNLGGRGRLDTIVADLEAVKKASAGNNGRLTMEAVKQASDDTETSVLEHQVVAATLNAESLLLENFVKAASLFADSKHSLTSEEYLSDRDQEVPISTVLIRRFLDAAHIIGMRSIVDSKSIKRDVDVVSLFNLEAIRRQDEDDS